MLDQKLTNILNTYGDGFIEKLRDKLQSIIKPPATGAGAKSLSYEAKDMALRVSGLSYLSALDTGTRRYTNYPSPVNLEKWILAKGIKSDSGMSTKKLAFAISRSIRDRGTRPTDFLDIVFREDRARLDQMLLDGIEEYIETIVSKPYAEQNK
jgi:hypothetical protein